MKEAIKLTCNGVTLHEREIDVYRPPMEFLVWRGRVFVRTNPGLYEERLTLHLRDESA